MGSSQSTESSAEGGINVQELAKNSPLTTEEVEALLISFRKYSAGKKNGQVTKEHFKKIIADANDLVPHVFFADVSMNDNDGGLGLKDTIQPGFADGIFQLFDTDHDGRIAFDELLQGLSIVCEGNVKEKAALAFNANDLDRNGYLDRKEMERAIKQTMKNSKKLIRSKVRRVLKNEGVVGVVASPIASAAAMMHFSNVDDDKIIKSLIDQIFEADVDQDGKLSKQEWVDHAEKNPMIKDFLTWSFGNGVVECDKHWDLDNMRSPECKQQ